MRFSIHTCVPTTLAAVFVLLIGGLAGNASGQCSLANISSEPAVGSNAMAVVVSGTTAYAWIFGTRGNFLEVIDVADPANPVQLSFTNIGGLAFNGHLGMVLSGSRLYLADLIIGLQVIDVSVPTAPFFLGSVATPTLAYGVTVSGTRVYVADGLEGLQVIDVSDPDPLNWNILGSVDTPGFARGVTVSGTLAYVADGPSGLQVIDLSDPDPMNWNILGSVGLPSCSGGAVEVTLSGNRVYLAYEGAGLQVADVSNPAAPFFLGSVATTNSARGVAVSGTVAYVVQSGDPMQFIDLGLCQLGACCIESVCVDLLSEANCLALGGTFFGDGSSCATADCSGNSCGGAIPIALGDTLFTTIGATTDGPINIGCDLSDGTLFTNDIWYEFTALSNGTLTVSTCGQSDFDTIIAAYTGACGSLNLVTCDDQGCESQSIMTFAVTAGLSYLLRVGGWNNQTGTGTLSLTLESCDADISGDTTINVTDLLLLLGAWGVCP